MQRNAIADDLSSVAFDFFFWFSRFEFALKENQYLQDRTRGANAEPGWCEFSDKWQAGYTPSSEAKYLLSEPPERQIVGQGGALSWKTVGLADCKSDLARVIRLLKTVRNNLFHGGKHGGAGWDNPARTRALLEASHSVIDQFVEMAGMQADYTQTY